MATEEKSRDTHEPRKRYAAVGMQQGRVLLDDDFNEAETIRLEEERAVNLDVIGAVGSPDDGFRIANGHLTNGQVDFDILAGTLYVGGLRVWNPEPVTYALQPDWVNQADADRGPVVAGRTDLVYLEVWRQPVTAIEDAELFEVALAGPDTSTRMRTMWRVRLAKGVEGEDCPRAWQQVVAGWEAAGLGTVDETGERVVDAKLAVGFIAGEPGDLCTPSIAGGYLGAENQTIRVQLADASHFTWGYDNGAPLYRATLAADNRTLTLLTEPRDRAHWPMAGQVIEVLPWSSVLVNGEKLAEETGHFARVTTSYDPDTRQLVIAAADAVPAGFGAAWQGRADAASLGAPFFFVRVWNRGDDHVSPSRIPFVPGTPVPLGTTGLTVTFTGTAHVPGDHWIIAARPRTPDRVVPWDLEVGRSPHGVRRFFAPLALIRWHQSGTFDVLHDCRPHFLPLTKLRGCCTYTVGDGVHSFGRFERIQDAIDALPPEGGKVCVLPGMYRETVRLLDRRHVTIEGCGPRSLLRPGEGQTWTILMAGCSDIVVRDLGFATGDAFGIVVLDQTQQGGSTDMAAAPWASVKNRSRRLRFERLTMRVGGRSAIAVLGGIDLAITDCEIVAGPLENVIDRDVDLGRWPAILSFADDALIEGNRISVATEPATAPTTAAAPTFTRTALGGIQIGGGAERVEIRRNHIAGGNGDGITLGSWAWVPARLVEREPEWGDVVANWYFVPAGFHITINDRGCIEVDWDPLPPPTTGDELVPVSMGAVYEVRIVDNLIERMGRAGIGVARFFDLSRRDEMIVVRGLHVEGNRIHDCIQLPIPELPAAMREYAAMGAILLADVERLVVRGNDISRNGRRHIDPVCGVFALVATGMSIESNRIVDNAPHVATEERVRPGWRGGVVVTRAFTPTYTLTIGQASVLRQNGEPAVRIANNVIVVPEGRPVLVLAHGPVAIIDNHLTTRGVGLADIAALLGSGSMAQIEQAVAAGALQPLVELFGGIAVFVYDTGMSNEVNMMQLSWSLLQRQELSPRPGIDPREPVAASGNIMFHGNQVGIDLLGAPNNLALSGVLLAGIDDVQGSENQIELDRLADRVQNTWFAMGLSTRITDNRVKESLSWPLNRELTQGTSITSVGVLFNMTTSNQTTRCISVIGMRRTDQPNHVLLEVLGDNACARNRDIATDFAMTHLDVPFANRS